MSKRDQIENKLGGGGVSLLRAGIDPNSDFECGGEMFGPQNRE